MPAQIQYNSPTLEISSTYSLTVICGWGQSQGWKEYSSEYLNLEMTLERQP